MISQVSIGSARAGVPTVTAHFLPGALLVPHKVADVNVYQSCFPFRDAVLQASGSNQVVVAFLWSPCGLLILTSDP